MKTVMLTAALLVAAAGLGLGAQASAEALSTAELEALLGSEASPVALPPDGCFNPCFGSHTTSPGGGQASHWGKGSSCAAAGLDLTNQLNLAADQTCGANGACRVVVVVTGSCWWSSQYQKYVVDGYATFGCSADVC